MLTRSPLTFEKREEDAGSWSIYVRRHFGDPLITLLFLKDKEAKASSGEWISSGFYNLSRTEQESGWCGAVVEP